MQSQAKKQIEQPKKLEKFIENIVALVEAYLKLFRLEITEGLAHALSIVVVLGFMGMLFAFVGLFASIAFAYFLAAWLAITLPYCLLIVAGFYLILLLLVAQTRNFFRTFIFNILQKIINRENDD